MAAGIFIVCNLNRYGGTGYSFHGICLGMSAWIFIAWNLTRDVGLDFIAWNLTRDGGRNIHCMDLTRDVGLDFHCMEFE